MNLCYKHLIHSIALLQEIYFDLLHLPFCSTLLRSNASTKKILPFITINIVTIINYRLLYISSLKDVIYKSTIVCSGIIKLMINVFFVLISVVAIITSKIVFSKQNPPKRITICKNNNNMTLIFPEVGKSFDSKYA